MSVNAARKAKPAARNPTWLFLEFTGTISLVSKLVLADIRDQRDREATHRRRRPGISDKADHFGRLLHFFEECPVSRVLTRLPRRDPGQLARNGAATGSAAICRERTGMDTDAGK
jgi:hypothetical protein